MKVGDLVNYTGEPFDGPSVNGLVLETNYLQGAQHAVREVIELKVYWATHGITSWCMERDLEAANASR